MPISEQRYSFLTGICARCKQQVRVRKNAFGASSFDVPLNIEHQVINGVCVRCYINRPSFMPPQTKRDTQDLPEVQDDKFARGLMSRRHSASGTITLATEGRKKHEFNNMVHVTSNHTQISTRTCKASCSPGRLVFNDTRRHSNEDLSYKEKQSYTAHPYDPAVTHDRNTALDQPKVANPLLQSEPSKREYLIKKLEIVQKGVNESKTKRRSSITHKVRKTLGMTKSVKQGTVRAYAEDEVSVLGMEGW